MVEDVAPEFGEGIDGFDGDTRITRGEPEVDYSVVATTSDAVLTSGGECGVTWGSCSSVARNAEFTVSFPRPTNFDFISKC